MPGTVLNALNVTDALDTQNNRVYELDPIFTTI